MLLEVAVGGAAVEGGGVVPLPHPAISSAQVAPSASDRAEIIEERLLSQCRRRP
jgi:hypothetical protein